MATSAGKVIVTIAALAALFAESPAMGKDRRTPSERIIGKWSSLIRLPDGKGFTLVFKRDGTFEQHVDFEKAARWKVKESKLIFETWNKTRSRIEKQEFEFELRDNSLVLRDSALEAEVRMLRLFAADGAAGEILGEWYSENFPGAVSVMPAKLPLRFPAFVEFDKDHRVYFRSIPINAQKGRYEFVGKELVVSREGQPPVRCKPRFPRNRVMMPITPKGPEGAFRHVPTSENPPLSVETATY